MLTTTIQGFSTRIDGLQGEIQRHPAAARPGPVEPRPPEGRAAPGARPPRGRARPARAAAQRAGHRAPAARRPARGDLQVRHPRRADRRAGVRRLRRPARARRVPRAHLRPGPRDHRPRPRPARPGAGPGGRSSPSSSSASSWPPSASSSERDQIASAQNQLVSSRDQLASARADKRGALAQVRDREAERRWRTSPRSQAEQARVARRPPGRAAPGPIKQGSGQLIWPVNGPVAGAFGECGPGTSHAGVDIAVPEGTPIRAADSGRVALMGWVGGYGNYTCIQHTATMSTCYGHQSRFATSNGASVIAGPGDRLQRQHRQLDGPAPALRGAHQRDARRPDGLPY